MKTIQLEKGRLLAVMVPDDVEITSVQMHCNNNGLEPGEPPTWWQNIYSSDRKFIESISDFGWSHSEPKGFDLIGLSDQVTEEQAKMIVGVGEVWGSLMLLNSLLQANEIYSVNPYPKCECKMFTKEFERCSNINTPTTSCSLFEKHKIAQSNTGKWYLLFEPK